MRVIALPVAALVLTVSAARAEQSFYVGGGASFSHLETFNFVQDSGFGDAVGDNQSARSGQFSRDVSGWQLFGGWMWSRNFGVLVKYTDGGDASDSWFGEITTSDPNAPQAPPVVDSFEFRGSMSIEGYGLYLVQTLPITDELEFSLHVGWTDQELDLDWSSTEFSGSLSRDDTGIAGAGLVRYRFLEDFAVSGEIEYLSADFRGLLDDQIRYALNLEYHF